MTSSFEKTAQKLTFLFSKGVGEALVGLSYMKAMSDPPLKFKDRERELVWHAADTLDRIGKSILAKQGQVPSLISNDLEKFTDRLFQFSRYGEQKRLISNGLPQVIDRYLDELVIISNHDKEVLRSVNKYRKNPDFGLSIFKNEISLRAPKDAPSLT